MHTHTPPRLSSSSDTGPKGGRRRGVKGGPHRSGAVAAAVIVAAVLLALLARRAPAPRDHVQLERIPSTDGGRWAEEGFVEMVAPIRPPSSPDASVAIEIWLRLPLDGLIDLAGPGARDLVLPVGTEADRVEVLRRPEGEAQVLDVRGTRLGPDAQQFHVFRPVDGELLGLSWPRGDDEAQGSADERLAELVRPDELARMRRLNQCAGCHGANKPVSDRVDEGGLPHRATDAQGFYGVRAVLEKSLPLERSRPRDMNVDQPFVHVFCPSSVGPPTIVRREGGAQRVDCADGAVAWAELDVVSALAAGDEYAGRVCRSRGELRARMTARAAEAFSDAFAACGGETGTSSTPLEERKGIDPWTRASK